MRIWKGRAIVFAAAAAILSIGAVRTAPQELGDVEEMWRPETPAVLAGPYVEDPDILAEFDRSDADCAKAGPLNFRCLISRDDRSAMKSEDADGNPPAFRCRGAPDTDSAMPPEIDPTASNPFSLPVFQEARQAVACDLGSIHLHPEFGGDKAASLRSNFLRFAGARIELVGVINRMDRQFNDDIVPEHHARLPCGEISAIYRFGYKGSLNPGTAEERRYGSRLPITMNVVFSARPWSGGPDCPTVASRWLAYAEAMAQGAAPDILRDKARIAIASLRPEDVDRIELNMQGSRVPASDDDASKTYDPSPAGTDFGTLATYVIRVFRWAPGPNQTGHWHVSYLSNQIDRARLTGLAGDDNSCQEEWGKPLSRRVLADFLLGTKGIGDVDNGVFNIPKPFLACRAVSVSPGGASRSENQPFWNTKNSGDAILTDASIEAALARFKRQPKLAASLHFVGTADEFRTRLNEASCSGCHQSRAIAGFHFPGADVRGTSPVNAVFMPGSPHFYGDQLRRMDILRKIAAGQSVSRYGLATSYATRPLERYSALQPNLSLPREQQMQLAGGWGGACLISSPPGGKRRWPCAGKLECRALFASANDTGVGTCVNPDADRELGDAMQRGHVVSTSFGRDRYYRDPAVDIFDEPGHVRNTTIPVGALTAPPGNSYFAAHQEYYDGRGGLNRLPGESDDTYARRVRDQGTGGFPAGSLRLSECKGLPKTGTCALLASTGFNNCLGRDTPETCFRLYTAYAGVRACNPANPCRDDYICLSPMRYTAQNAAKKFGARKDARKTALESYPPDSERYRELSVPAFGNEMPDNDWLSRNGGNGDRRGVCIPPYFVFQFRADGHHLPAKP